MKKQEENLFNEVMQSWGFHAQADIAEEEAAEFILALKHFKRNREDSGTNLVEEIADLSIMVDQMKLFVGVELVDEVRAAKLRRLKYRLHQHKESLKIKLEQFPPNVLNDGY